MAISQVEQIPVGELRLNPANVRKHSRKRVDQRAEIIKQVGFLRAATPGTPADVRAVIRRWQRHTGDHAVHAISGRRFDEIEEPKSGKAVASRKAGRNHRTVRKSKGREVAANLKSARKVTVAELPPWIRRTK